MYLWLGIAKGVKGEKLSTFKAFEHAWRLTLQSWQAALDLCIWRSELRCSISGTLQHVCWSRVTPMCLAKDQCFHLGCGDMLEVAPSAEWTQQKASHVILGWGVAWLMRPMKLQGLWGLILLKYQVTASFVPVGLSLYGPCRASGSPFTALEVFGLNQMYYSPLGTAAWWRKPFISFLLLLFLLSVVLSGTCCELLMQILQQWRTEISASCSRNISGCCLQPSSWSPPEECTTRKHSIPKLPVNALLPLVLPTSWLALKICQQWTTRGLLMN